MGRARSRQSDARLNARRCELLPPSSHGFDLDAEAGRQGGEDVPGTACPCTSIHVGSTQSPPYRPHMYQTPPYCLCHPPACPKSHSGSCTDLENSLRPGRKITKAAVLQRYSCTPNSVLQRENGHLRRDLDGATVCATSRCGPRTVPYSLPC